MSTETTANLAESFPSYIVAPGETDILYVVVIVMVVVGVLLIGVFYLKLHALPEQLAHAYGSNQMRAVAALSLLAMFTHNNMFWVAALLLVVLKFPDYLSPLKSIAASLAEMAKPEEPPSEAVVPAVADEKNTEEAQRV